MHTQPICVAHQRSQIATTFYAVSWRRKTRFRLRKRHAYEPERFTTKGERLLVQQVVNIHFRHRTFNRGGWLISKQHGAHFCLNAVQVQAEFGV